MERASAGVAYRLRSVPLLWKLLVPFLILIVLIGTAGAVVVVRDAAARANTNLDRDLTQRSLEARSYLHDRELYVLESASLAANLQGMAVAVQRGDAETVGRLLTSMLALKTDVSLAAV